MKCILYSKELSNWSLPKHIDYICLTKMRAKDFNRGEGNNPLVFGSLIEKGKILKLTV